MSSRYCGGEHDRGSNRPRSERLGLEYGWLRSPASRGGRFRSFALFVGTSVPLWHLLLIGQAYCRRQRASQKDGFRFRKIFAFDSCPSSSSMELPPLAGFEGLIQPEIAGSTSFWKLQYRLELMPEENQRHFSRVRQWMSQSRQEAFELRLRRMPE
jgi:hypothetical protein